MENKEEKTDISTLAQTQDLQPDEQEAEDIRCYQQGSHVAFETLLLRYRKQAISSLFNLSVITIPQRI